MRVQLVLLEQQVFERCWQLLAEHSHSRFRFAADADYAHCLDRVHEPFAALANQQHQRLDPGCRRGSHLNLALNAKGQKTDSRLDWDGLAHLISSFRQIIWPWINEAKVLFKVRHAQWSMRACQAVFLHNEVYPCSNLDESDKRARIRKKIDRLTSSMSSGGSFESDMAAALQDS